MRRPNNRLVLVGGSAKSNDETDQAKPVAGVAHRLETILQNQIRDGKVGFINRMTAPSPFSTDQVPLTIRLTMAQILDVADATELRADVLHDLASAIVAGVESTTVQQLSRIKLDRRVDSLRDVADALRFIAGDFVDRWVGPKPRPS